MLSIKNLSKTYGDKTLFENISFKLKGSGRTALVGLNGAGKTTLIKIILGQEEPDSGVIEIKTKKIFYVPQKFDNLNRTIEKIISNEGCFVDKKNYLKLKNILEIFKLEKIEPTRKLSSLSGGELKKFFLALALSKEVDFLILDEPTNDIDMESLIWIENFLLNQFKGTLLIVSHDRRFLDNVVNNVLELRKEGRNKPSKISRYSGNYSSFVEIKNQEVKKGQTLYHLQQKNIKAIKTDIEKTKQQALKGERETTDAFLRGKAKKVAKKAKVREARLEKMLDSENFIEKPIGSRLINFNPDVENIKRGQLMLFMPKFDLLFKEVLLIKDVLINLHAGDKKALVGANGTGKTALLKKIIEKPDTLKIGEKTKIGYVPQDLHFSNENQTCVEFLENELGVSQSEGREILAKILLRDREAFKKISDLSQGQKLKLYLAKIIGGGANLLLLDEPTNNLDLESLSEIENGLKNFQGSLLIVSHDRYFLKNVGISDILYIAKHEIKHESSVDDLEKFILTQGIRSL